MKFQTTLELGGKTATGFRVPSEVVEALGAGKKPKLRVTTKGCTSFMSPLLTPVVIPFLDSKS